MKTKEPPRATCREDERAGRKSWGWHTRLVLETSPERWLYLYLVWVCQLAQSTLGCTRKMFRDRSQALWDDSMGRGRSDDWTFSEAIR